MDPTSTSLTTAHPDPISCNFSFSLFYTSLFLTQMASLQNLSIFNNSQSDLIHYTCAYVQFQHYTNNLAFIIGLMYAISTGLGLIGAVSIFGTLYNNEHFNSPCFMVYRIMCFLELAYTPFKLIHAYSWMHFPMLKYTYNWTWAFYVLSRTLGNVAAQSVETMALFLSIERAAATLIPHKFHLFDHKNVYIAGTCVSFLIGLVLWVPNFVVRMVIVDNSTGTVSAGVNWMGETYAFYIYERASEYFGIGNGIATLVTSGLVAIGTLKTWRKRARLLRQVNTTAVNHPPGSAAVHTEPKRPGIPQQVGLTGGVPAGNTGETLDTNGTAPTQLCAKTGQLMRLFKKGPRIRSTDPNAANINSALQLCFLQISLSTPIAINAIFIQLLTMCPMREHDGVIHIPSGYRFWTLRCLVNITDSISHGFEFYFYLIFSRTFRETFFKRFLKRGDAEVSTASQP